jgi:hypothetical protein
MSVQDLKLQWMAPRSRLGYGGGYFDRTPAVAL